MGLGAAMFLAVALWAFLVLALWAARDAHRRGKPALLVLIAVVLFFPWGLIGWLLFRPPVSRFEPDWRNRSLPLHRQ